MGASEAPIPFLDLGAMHEQLRPRLDDAWHAAVDSSGFIGGSSVERFEEEFASYCGTDHAIGVANGTDALSLILRALDVGSGDEVIVPTNTFVATAEAVIDVGASPVFVDIDPATLLITADAVRAAITERTTAVMVVHLYGQVADMDALVAVCDEHGLHLIEDAAQAHGATWNDRVAGSFGIAAGFSFYPGKNLGAFGDGGAVVTDDAELASTIRSMANHGRNDGDAHRHDVVGGNSRLDALQADVLSIKLDALDSWNERRRVVHSWYAELLPDEVRQVEIAPAATSVHHLEIVEVDDRDLVRAQLADRGIATGIHYPVPCHRVPAFEPYVVAGRDDFPVADRSAGRLLSLPMYPSLERADVARVCTTLRDVLPSAAAVR